MHDWNPPSVLLVEDSPGDIELAQRALAKCELPHALVVAEDATEALALLSGDVARGVDPLRPALVVLDLNLPGMDGRQLLNVLKDDRRWRRIPVLVLSTSVQRADVQACYRSGASGYYRKPDDFREYQEMFRELIHNWLADVAAADHDKNPHSTV